MFPVVSELMSYEIHWKRRALIMLFEKALVMIASSRCRRGRRG